MGLWRGRVGEWPHNNNLHDGMRWTLLGARRHGRGCEVPKGVSVGAGMQARPAEVALRSRLPLGHPFATLHVLVALLRPKLSKYITSMPMLVFCP